ncbi:ExeA family protein [Vibrio rumoiensis]|uniref:MSHA biogenesis protein MshM n=1 Tax=Vibrio rumoiensis 1S-45 TaxID=1188252 RepID=A0A1E5E555_9VIBR|nr:AAA family ATPase [Vibrio rumoiensis]OEF28475.1 MSHA biogenesis protein MshM [Vibrio rumoiensis 1S-45]
MVYQSYFGLSQAPFSLTPTTALFHGLEPHFEAIQTVLSAIDMGEGIIKVTGEVGTGKTLVCRMLINHLKDKVHLVYLPNPILNGVELKQAVAHELSLASSLDSVSLVDAIHTRLLEIHQSGKTVVALIDEAQALSDEAVETLRLFGNLETEHRKLLQMVILGQPELDERLAQHSLRQFRQRITFSAKLRPLTLAETVAYIDHRIEKSGGDTAIFSLRLKKSIWKATQGIPRMINQVCHKSLLMAFMGQQKQVQTQHLFSALHDTFDVKKPKYKTPYLWGWS